jgi:translation elongation factor EF-Tu-like GTPase
MTDVFQMPVQSMFHMPGQGTILHGKIVFGRISMGSRIVVASPNRFVSAKVAGIEGIGTKTSLSSAGSGDDIAILVRNLDLTAVSDGWNKTPEGIIVPIALRVCNDPRPWWTFWP